MPNCNLELFHFRLKDSDLAHFVCEKPPLIITADQYLLRKMAINVIIVKKDLHKIESEIKFFLFSGVYSWLLKVIKGNWFWSQNLRLFMLWYLIWTLQMGGRILLDIKGEFSWTSMRIPLFGWIFVDTFFNSNEKSYIIIK